MSDEPTQAQIDKAPPGTAWPISTVLANGKLAERRFTTAQAVREVNYRLFQLDMKDAERRALIKRMYDGNAPYDPERLRSLGIGNITNVNFLGLKGAIDSRSTVLSRIALDSVNLIELHPIGQDADAGYDARHIGDIVADEVSRLLRSKPRLVATMSMMIKECELYGIGPVTWPTYREYMPIALERGQLRMLPQAAIISGENDLYQFESELPVYYLVSVVNDPAAAEAQGWNVSAVKDYLDKCFAQHMDTRGSMANEMGTSIPESALSMIRQNRIYEPRMFDVVRVLHTYVREVSGNRKISHIMTSPNLVANPNAASDQNNNRPVEGEFLFYKVDAYDTMDQCMIWFPYQVNIRFAREARGLASFLFHAEDVNNRLMCQVMDSGFRAASFILQRKPGMPNAELSIAEKGPYTIIPADLTPAQSQVSPNLQVLIGLREVCANMANNNALGNRGGPLQMPERIYSGADRRSKDEAASETARSSRQEEELYVYRMTVLDLIFREIFRRICVIIDSIGAFPGEYPEIEALIRRCEARGVPKKILLSIQDNFQLYTCRDLVNGGASAKAGILADLLERFGGNLDEAGRRTATRELVMSKFGSLTADRYSPDFNRDEAPTNASSLATLENNALAGGQTAMVGMDQLHWAHIPVHIQVVQQIVQQVQAGDEQQIEDPARMLAVLETTSKHLQEHLEIGRRQLGMEGRAKQIDAFLRTLGNVAKQLNMMAQAQAKAQEAQQKQAQMEQQKLRDEADQARVDIEKHRIDKDAEVKRYGVELHADIERQKAGGQVQVAAEKTAAATDISRRKAEADMQVRSDKAAASAQTSASVNNITGRPNPQDFAAAPISASADNEEPGF